jgi:hypothetical protein
MRSEATLLQKVSKNTHEAGRVASALIQRAPANGETGWMDGMESCRFRLPLTAPREGRMTRSDRIKQTKLQIEGLADQIAALERAKLSRAELERLTNKLAAKRAGLEAMQQREALSIEVSRILARNKGVSIQGASKIPPDAMRE